MIFVGLNGQNSNSRIHWNYGSVSAVDEVLLLDILVKELNSFSGRQVYHE